MNSRQGYPGPYSVPSEQGAWGAERRMGGGRLAGQTALKDNAELRVSRWATGGPTGQAELRPPVSHEVISYPHEYRAHVTLERAVSSQDVLKPEPRYL